VVDGLGLYAVHVILSALHIYRYQSTIPKCTLHSTMQHDRLGALHIKRVLSSWCIGCALNDNLADCSCTSYHPSAQATAIRTSHHALIVCHRFTLLSFVLYLRRPKPPCLGHNVEIRRAIAHTRSHPVFGSRARRLPLCITHSLSSRFQLQYRSW
jgi:hypothetical protein